ncbi:MAG: hypothetical protein ABJF23_29410 [Bryobacteraceae bacterium]
MRQRSAAVAILRRSTVVLAFLLAPFAGTQAEAQQLPDTATAQPVILQRIQIPSELWDIATSMGDRLTTAGNERLTLTGTLTDKRGNTPVVISTQLPSLFRYEELDGKNKKIVFDGSRATSSAGSLAEDDLNLAETFFSDSAENFLYSLKGGGSLRRIGGRFRTDDGKAPKYAGPYWDVYELEAAVGLRSDR